MKQTGKPSCLGLVDTLRVRVTYLRKEVHMPNTKPPYPPEFRAESVRLYRESGKSMSTIAQDLGVSVDSLRAWIRRDETDSGKRADLTTSEREEIRQLRRENRILREEREILKKAAAYFAKETYGYR